MTHSARRSSNVVGLLTVVAISAVTMLWLLWHHPVTTTIVTLLVIAAFAISARLARMVDADLSDDQGHNRA